MQRKQAKQAGRDRRAEMILAAQDEKKTRDEQLELQISNVDVRVAGLEARCAKLETLLAEFAPETQSPLNQEAKS
ncbi:hypothetical protein G6O69_37980 [Pseudenhygromyxa sp. WMMC2535]|uniref:hypothetical protein n=1 Tax=Pseudenhygromyxa sp. WMMC2535 TaxID=2712867 RepID=UPI0015951BC7|nr:hypothetical protein [Pseudenhygromyxa sp. WMMC2535]NVB38212.1 hypothetical protein [Pseudenhygromyxa sp. WMMC2535]NVB41611.1 hypothetical protein [Pseudenhygromyxa sp. WMMC2535]NVB43635.1 hypothetical protein [Pseudenhygromyxa sp. WMMC2535]NVB43660.1 hypothetical protein [Pseudenhygromyxa sp. WMMC2535]